MKKTIQRVGALLLCLAMLMGFASCAQAPEDGIPAGMHIASCSGADYRLYVPTTWVLNTSYGVSGAYRNLSQQSTVSVQRYATAEYRAEMEAAIAQKGADPAASGERIAWFWENVCLPVARAQALDQEISMKEGSPVAAVLGGANATRYLYSGLINGQTLHFLQVVAEHGEGFYVFTFIATAELYELYLSEVESMLTEFIFSDTGYVPLDYAKHLDNGKNAPEGMKSAFGDDVAYCFYVPSSWNIRMDDSVYSAHVEIKDEATGGYDRTSVSVIPHLPQNASGQMSVAEYFEWNRSEMEKIGGADGFELISTTEGVSLGGRQATLYEYRFRVGGEWYHYRQYVAAYRSMIYSLTYTSTDAYYSAHLAELEAIVGAFQFR